MPICGAGADTYKSMLTSVPAFDRAAEHRQNRTKLTFRAIQQRVVTALFRRGAQDPSKVDRLKGTTQRIGRVSSSHLAATNHRAGMSHCCDLPHCDIPAPSPAPALEATSSAVLCPIVLLSARAAGHVRNYRPRLVGTSPHEPIWAIGTNNFKACGSHNGSSHRTATCEAAGCSEGSSSFKSK